MNATRAARARITALLAKSTTGPLASNTTPPIVAPRVMANWMTATMSPPPASASSGRVRVSQVPQATGAGVPTRPQRARRTAVIHVEVPNRARARATPAMIRGTAASVRGKLAPTALPITKLPMRPATPTTRSRVESVETSTPVTCSRNGRR
jgi:hypothetical protein